MTDSVNSPSTKLINVLEGESSLIVMVIWSASHCTCFSVDKTVEMVGTIVVVTYPLVKASASWKYDILVGISSLMMELKVEVVQVLFWG